MSASTQSFLFVVVEALAAMTRFYGCVYIAKANVSASRCWIIFFLSPPTRPLLIGRSFLELWEDSIKVSFRQRRR